MEAEFLLLGNLPASAIRGYIVYNDNAATTLLQLGVAAEKMIVRPTHYF